MGYQADPGDELEARAANLRGGIGGGMGRQCVADTGTARLAHAERCRKIPGEVDEGDLFPGVVCE